MRFFVNAFFVLLGLASVFVLVHVSSDYLGTLASLQDFRWGVAGFAEPQAGASEAHLTLEVQNRSGLDLDFKDLEVYLWLQDKTVGKTYGRFETRTVSAHSTAHIPLTILLDDAQLREALAGAPAERAWFITGTYKASAPFASNDFTYGLRLDVNP